MSTSSSQFQDGARDGSAPVRIKVLGPPSIQVAGQEAPLARRQLRALVYRLALASAPIARDHLCFLFWPDDPDEAARRKLTVLVHLLRRGLAPHDPVLVSEGALRLDSTLAWVDASAFTAGVQTAVATRKLFPLSEAIALYRGPVLEGFGLAGSTEFERWLADERQHWERHYCLALVRLIDGASAVGDYAQAIDSAERYLQVDELAEDIHRRLIWLYGAVGNRSSALRQFERCAAILERELGVGVLPETQAMFESIRDQTEPAQAQRAEQSGAHGSPTWTLEAAGAAGLLASKPLFGRERELATIQAMLNAETPRLITLSGPGGSGKTHLAQHIAGAATLPDGAVWVSLAALRVPGLLLDAIAHACGVREQAGATPAAVHAALRGKRMLLVLDNAEHMLAAVSVVAELLLAAPQLRVLVTSRAALNLPGEQMVPVPPLPVPALTPAPSLESLAAQPAVALLVQRLRERQPAFQLTQRTALELAEICVRLEGLPLALELASARLISLAPGALLARLNHRLTLLTRGPHHLPERQQTLRATVDWSYRLLDLDAQATFCSLAVFAGGWSLAAAAAVMQGQRPADAPALDELAVLDLMHGLLEQNMIFSIPADEPRFGMLETLREYAHEQLAARGGAGAAAAAHAAFYRDLAASAAPHLRGPDGASWLDQMAREHDNLRSAFAWFLAHAGGSAELLDFADTLYQFWWWRGEYHEARQWLEQALECSRGQRSAQRINLLLGAGKVAAMLGDQDAAIAWFEAGIALCGESDTLMLRSQLLLDLARIYGDRGAFAQACQVLEDALASRRAMGDPYLLILPLRCLAGMLCGSLVNVERGILLFEEGLALARELASTGAFHAANIAVFLNDFAFYLAMLGAHERAESLMAECQALTEQISFTPMIPIALQTRGQLALLKGDRAAARRAFRSSQAALGEESTPRVALGNLDGLAEAAVDDDPLLATKLFAAADSARRKISMLIEPVQQPFYARALDRLRGSLGAERFVAAWREGQAWTAEQALAAAIDIAAAAGE